MRNVAYKFGRSPNSTRRKPKSYVATGSLSNEGSLFWETLFSPWVGVAATPVASSASLTSVVPLVVVLVLLRGLRKSWLVQEEQDILVMPTYSNQDQLLIYSPMLQSWYVQSI